MAIKALIEHDYLLSVVSQNTDGLHLRSGLDYGRLFELHGNRNLEECTSCKTKFFSSYRVRTKEDPKDHLTGRMCSQCGGSLKDMIIHFGESLPKETLTSSLLLAANCSFCLALGSSLSVTPANIVPGTTLKYKGSLALVNLQTTPFDKYARFRLHCMTDDAMRVVMAELGIEVREWKPNSEELIYKV